jgi:LAO/AO transport system kinase
VEEVPVKDSPEGLYERLLEGDRRAAARLISMVENGDRGAREVLKMLHRRTGRAHIVGLTGSPGGGKSTLACGLARKNRDAGKTVGIICVDPTSPFTGGALLGDRVRMQELAGDPDVFIRSMGSRGALGGLSVATNDAINILDAFGKDLIIVETVGAGQVEIEVVKYAHTCVVVTMPGAGDQIQAIKAGILEIGDVFVVNKADREGAQRTLADLEMMIETRPASDGASWKPPVLATVALEGEGMDELEDAIARHAEYLRSTGLLEAKTEQRMKAELLGILDLMVLRAAGKALEDGEGKELVRRMVARELDPHSAAEEVVAYLKRAGG